MQSQSYLPKIELALEILLQLAYVWAPDWSPNMSQQDRENERLQILEDHVKQVLKSKKAIIVCPECDETEIDNSNGEAVIRALIQLKKELEFGKIDCSKEEIEDTVSNVMSDIALDCPNCEEDDYE